MKASMIFLIFVAVASAAPHRWELVPTRDGGVELYDTTAPPPQVRVTTEDVIFELYTQANPTTADILQTGVALSGNFVASRPTKFVSHGWLNDGANMYTVRDGWLAAGDYNVIVVDWSAIASSWIYSQAKAAVPEVGTIAASLVDWIVSQGASTSNIELVGHSLGAHVSGVIGNRVTSGQISRITGLDPAAPLFGLEDVADRLDSSDAAYVEVIHTNAGYLGWYDPMGHSDFYPNGGVLQPGCTADIFGACSHGRSVEFFAESITTTVGFVGTQCGSESDYDNGNCASNPTSLMGQTTPTSASGTYYLTTASSSPYALG